MITGDIDILRYLIQDIQHLANILSDNQYLTPPHPGPPPFRIMEMISVNSSRFFQTVTFNRATNNVKIKPKFKLYRFTLYILRSKSITCEKLYIKMKCKTAQLERKIRILTYLKNFANLFLW